MTEVFLDPYDIWNPKWSPLDFNSFKWIVKPSKLSPMNGEFKVAVDVAGFTATDDRLDVEVLLENNEQMLCIQGEHVDDDGRCFTRRNLLKLYRIDGECIPETLCVFIADDVLVARVLVEKGGKSPDPQASLRDSVIRSESQTEMRQHRSRAPTAEKRQVSTVSTSIKHVEPREHKSAIFHVQHTHKTVNDQTTSPPSTQQVVPGDAVGVVSPRPRSDVVKMAVPNMPFETMAPSQAKEPEVERGMVREVEREQAATAEVLEQKQQPMGVSKRATGDIMKLMSRFTGQQETSKHSPPSSRAQKHSAPTSPTLERMDTCVVHEARRASILTSIQPTAEKFNPAVEPPNENKEGGDCVEAENSVDFTVTIPKVRSGSTTTQSRRDSNTSPVAAASESFSHPYEEVEECEMEQKFREAHFSAAMNPHAGDEGQDILRVTLDVSDFPSNQLAMFIIGDEIVVNVEIARLVGNNKTLTKRYKLPANSDKPNVRSVLTSEGLLQIDVPMLKRNEPSQMALRADAVLATNF